jgi:hypothetical protein
MYLHIDSVACTVSRYDVWPLGCTYSFLPLRCCGVDDIEALEDAGRPPLPYTLGTLFVEAVICRK